MKIGTAEINSEMINKVSLFGNNLRGVCDYLNQKRPDLKPEWIIQILPPNANAIGSWIVVYRWPGQDKDTAK